MISYFEQHADELGELSIDAFSSVCLELVEQGPELDEEDELSSALVIVRLFELFDKNKDGKVSHDELVAGLSVLTGGTTDEKVWAAFQLYDEDGNGYIDLDESKWDLFWGFTYLIVENTFL